DRRRAIVALPQDVGVVVGPEAVVVVAGAYDVPARPRIERADGTNRHGIEAVHQPDRGCAVAVLPQDVRVAVVVEVAGALDLPARPRIDGTGAVIGQHGQAVHQPNCRRAIGALPQDVGPAVVIEVAGGLDLPARPGIELAGGPPAAPAVPARRS